MLMRQDMHRIHISVIDNEAHPSRARSTRLHQLLHVMIAVFGTFHHDQQSHLLVLFACHMPLVMPLYDHSCPVLL